MKRLLSALVLTLLVCVSICAGTHAVRVLIVVMGVLCAFELEHITRGKMRLIGCVYISASLASLLYLSALSHASRVLTHLFLSTYIADTAAFIFGSIIKGPKLAPQISPSKTWSGACAALLCCGCAGVLLGRTQSEIVLFPLLGCSAILGDLIESKVKRIYHVKDSGHLIPGHGGILDRVDSLLLTSICMGIFQIWIRL